MSFFSSATATTVSSLLSLHDALPILEHAFCRVADDRVVSRREKRSREASVAFRKRVVKGRVHESARNARSEEHTSELQSPDRIICRLLLEKKKYTKCTMLDINNTLNL